MLFLWVACTASTPLLNSERIEQRFGSYQVRVLSQSERIRISSLESRENGRAVTRTLAIVRFAPSDGRWAAEHERIVNGASIGATFRDAGWSIGKPLLQICALDLRSPVLAGLMNIPSPARLAVHVYRFDAARDGDAAPYATIVELHHPDYLALDELRRIYEVPGGDDVSAPCRLERRIRHLMGTLPPRLAHRMH